MEQFDVLETIGNSHIQHGKMNDRIYLMKMDLHDYPEIVYRLIDQAINKNYSKIFAKVPGWGREAFLERGFMDEARIPDFYNNSEDVYFMSKFMSVERGVVEPELREQINENLLLANKKAEKGSNKNDNGIEVKLLLPDDTAELAELYKKVFETYPFPIHEVDYLKKTMDENIKYFGTYEEGNLIAASSAEIDFKDKNAEMTDFATLPEKRGKGLASLLLGEMEKDMQKSDINSLYTIARAHSAGMNITFAKAGYQFAGTLINNTNISGKIESMNVWYKNDSK